MNEYKEEKDILIGLEQAKKVEERSKNKVCDWADEKELAILRADKRAEERKRELNAIVPTRVCPSCKRKIYIDSHWVVVDKLAWCRSCFHSQHKVEDKEEVSGKIIKNVIIRLEFDGWEIKILRDKVGVGVYAFADRCGWTKVYQEQIERNSMKTLSLGSILRIMRVFEDIGVTIIDTI